MNGIPPIDDRTLQEIDSLIQSALAEDLGEVGDCTSLALVPAEAEGSARFVARREGVICGLDICRRLLAVRQSPLHLESLTPDGDRVLPGQTIAVLSGDAREMLLVERTCLNFLGRLSGIATLTSEYVAAVSGTGALIHDTRKTTPGWRCLEKYAVRCGGGTNHRMGLYDAILIKDNHLAVLRRLLPGDVDAVAEAVRRARQWIAEQAGRLPNGIGTLLQIEVDRLEQLPAALGQRPHMVLLDNLNPEQLREAVGCRDRLAPEVILEASGGVTLATVRTIARTGVDRISVGALTHSAVNFDIGLDWEL